MDREKEDSVPFEVFLSEKKISTRLLTWLIICVIVHTEQRKREKRNLPEKVLTEFADVFRNSKLKTPAQHAANIDQEE